MSSSESNIDYFLLHGVTVDHVTPLVQSADVRAQNMEL